MKTKFYLVFNFLFILSLLLPAHFNGLYGFDWTDTTFDFQQALNILNNQDIGKDFFTHIPGFSYISEAFFLNFFGVSFENHRNLGLIFPIIEYLCCYLIIFKILALNNQKNYHFWSIIFSSLIIVSYWGTQLFWSNFRLAITYSFLIFTLIFFSYHKVNKILNITFVFLITLILILQILTKQSHGINLILTFISLLSVLLLKRKSIYFILQIISLFFIFLLFNILVLTYLTGLDFPITLSETTGSLDLKGLSVKRPLEIIFTIIGISTFKSIFYSIFIILSVIIFLFLFQKSSLRFFILIPLSISSITAYYFLIIWVILHYVLVGFLIYQFFYFCKNILNIKKLNEKVLNSTALFASSFPLIGSFVAEQLSWPGPNYIQPNLYMFLLIIMTVTYFLNNNNDFLINKKYFFIYLIIIFILSAFFIETKPRRYDHKNEGLVKIKNPATFRDWKVSKKTFEVIKKLIDISDNCGGNSLFQLSWMPISYEITSRKNITGYYLPYADTIGLEEGIKIVKSLNNNPPDLLILQPKYYNYDGPFPAKGLKYIYKNLDLTLEKYDFREKLNDNHNNFMVYCKKN